VASTRAPRIPRAPPSRAVTGDPLAEEVEGRDAPEGDGCGEEGCMRPSLEDEWLTRVRGGRTVDNRGTPADARRARQAVGWGSPAEDRRQEACSRA